MRGAAAPLGLGPILVCLTASALGGSARAQPLVRGRILSPQAPTLARGFRARGIDVVEGSVTTAALEIVGTRAEVEQLAAEGVVIDVIEVGHPLSPTPTVGNAPLLSDTVEPTAVPAAYENYEALTARAADLCATRPSVCQVVDLTAFYGAPPTFEGRHIIGVKLSDNVALDEDEPAVLIVAAHHAREIGTPLVALTALDHLVNGYGNDANVTAAIDGNQIWIVPVWNPDGYDYVFTTDNLWRKNRDVRDDGIGVDLNRNYPFGWDGTCSGSARPDDETYKGPAVASEAETQTMLRFAARERFAKVLDFHSAGQQVLYSFVCHPDPLAEFRAGEAVTLANLAGYAGAVHLPSAEGEHPQFETAASGAHAFLIEIETQFQPELAVSLGEAEQVWPAISWMLLRPISVAGHITDACTGSPIAADVAITDVTFTSGESNASGGTFGRYHLFLPAGPHALRVSAPGYRPTTAPVVVTDALPVVLDLALVPFGACGAGGAGGDDAPAAGRLVTPHPGGESARGLADAATTDNGCACAVGSSDSRAPSALVFTAWAVILLVVRRRPLTRG